MAQFKQWFEQDFTEKIEIRHCESIMFTGDDQGAVVGVRLYDDGTPYSGGGTVSGAVKRSDGGLVALTGTLSGNAASVVIPAAALAYAGPIGVRIVLNQGGSVTTVLKAIYSVDDNTGAAVDPGTIIPSVNDLITAINNAVASIPSDYSALLHTLAPDFSTSNTYSAGDYVWYNGTLYRFTADHAAGSWVGTDATAAVIGNDLSDLKSAITSMLFGNKWFEDGYQINSAGKWYPDANHSFYVFPVTPNDNLSVKSGAYATKYTFLKTYDKPETGIVPDYATGYSQYKSSPNEFSLIVPSDANYLIVAKTDRGNDIFPTWIRKDNYDYTLTDIENYNNSTSNIKIINSWPTAGFVNTSGRFISGGAWVTTDYYPAKNIKDIILKAYQLPGTVAIASFYDENKSFVYAIDTISGTTGNGEKYGHLNLSSVPTTAKYVRFSSNSTNYYIIITYDITETVLENKNDVTELKTNTISSNVQITQFNSNGFITYSDGTVYPGENWVYTDYQSAKNVISIKSKAYQYSTVALVAFYDENKNFLSAVNTYDRQSGSGLKEGTISVSQIPEGAVFMRFSSYASAADKYVDIKYDYTPALQEVIRTVPEIQLEVQNLGGFVNRLYGYPFSMAFIGDSLTHGQTYVHAQGTAGYAYKNKANYPDAFCRMMDADTKTVIAIPGATPGGVWDQEKTAIGNIQNQFVIVWLGTNGGLTDTVDTDCAGDNVDNYANTNTGNYGKIIKTLMDHGNKVFLAQLCYISHAPTSNPVIVKLAERFDCAVIALSADDIADLNQDKYHTAYNGYVNSVHFNSIGYNHVASVFFGKMMKLVYENPEDYEIYMVDNE